MSFDRLCQWLLCFALCAAAAAAEDDEKVKNGEYPPQTEIDVAMKIANEIPKSFKGRVYLDRNTNGKPDEGEGLASVRVTDGVDFATTDAEGRYTIRIKPDPLVPHQPSRTIGVCWPSGTWPTRLESGKFGWWVRLMDIKDPLNVDFRLLPRVQEEPVVVSFGTDPHDNFTRPHNFHWMDETAAAGDHVTFAVSGGDLGYMNFGNGIEAYSSIRKFTHDFPVLMPHCIGNHDIVGVHTTTWKIPHELAGYGAFVKHVGPARWSFDVAGIHFVGTDWSIIDEEGKMQCGLAESSLDWLERDLAALPEGSPVYFFNHQPWSSYQRFYQILEKFNVKLAIGGHSHRNMFLNSEPPAPGKVEFWTKMSLYTLIYARKDGFDFVDRCVYKGNRTDWNTPWNHETRGCALVNDFADGMNPEPKGTRVGTADLTLDGNTRKIDTVPGDTYDIRIGARGIGAEPASHWGLRVTGKNGTVYEFSYDEKADMLDLLGLKTPFHPVIPARNKDLSKVLPIPSSNPEMPDHWVEMRIMVTPDRIRMLVGNRLHHEKFITLGETSKIEVFTNKGPTEFKRIDVWQRTYPKDYKAPRNANSG